MIGISTVIIALKKKLKLYQALSVPSTAVVPQLGSLKQQKFILSWFWSLVVYSQVVSRPTFLLKTLGGIYSMPFS